MKVVNHSPGYFLEGINGLEKVDVFDLWYKSNTSRIRVFFFLR